MYAGRAGAAPLCFCQAEGGGGKPPSRGGLRKSNGFPPRCRIAEAPRRAALASLDCRSPDGVRLSHGPDDTPSQEGEGGVMGRIVPLAENTVSRVFTLSVPRRRRRPRRAASCVRLEAHIGEWAGSLSSADFPRIVIGRAMQGPCIAHEAAGPQMTTRPSLRFRAVGFRPPPVVLKPACLAKIDVVELGGRGHCPPKVLKGAGRGRDEESAGVPQVKAVTVLLRLGRTTSVAKGR
ncbi:hypothetical protein LY76DRAFT_195123 [Colletotrichum caudatum]|nr:hypothetical protein LY76DRAFT_195123 [Colletotrichum caudatum]